MNNIKILISLGLVFLLISSCYEKKEGCLDIYATNFDAQADKSCCCQYPKLALSFNHVLGANIYNETDTVTNDLGQAFKITSFTYYLSGFVLKDKDGNSFTTSDTFHIPTVSSEIIVKNDIAIVRPGAVSLILGSFSQKDDITDIQFQFGPPAEVEEALIDLIPSSRSLSRQPDTMYTPFKGYASIKIKYTTDITSDALEKTIYIYDKIPLDFNNIVYPLKIASNSCITILNDYKYWFHNVDVKLDDEALVKVKIIDNIKHSILIKQCD
ncbi:MAG TPA: MbnP family protein [Saprospiraceae bacterium]|nr:MbnP family protein [Saprospiraceae bacterium]